MKNSNFLVPVLIALCCITPASFQTQVLAKTFAEADFPSPPASVRMHSWWHWVDGNISRDGITKDLEAMHAQGIVQATILNVGLFDDRDFGVKKVRFGSAEWFEMFQWALTEAKRLQITLGVHNCDGWSSTGGPWITPEMSMKQFIWSKTIVKGGQKNEILLKEPQGLLNFYRDVAVVAYKTDALGNSFQKALPKIMLNDSVDASLLADGNPVSGLDVKIGDTINFSSETPMTFEKISVHPRRSFMWGNSEVFTTTYAVSSSVDGKNFTEIAKFKVTGLNKTEQVAVPPTTARFVRVQITDFSQIDSFIPVKIAELELLGRDENPSFNPAIPNILEKTVSSKSALEQNFYTIAKPEGKASIPSEAEVVVLTGKMDAKGLLHWDIPEGNWAILRFGYTTTGATNGPATREGTGLECDKMDSSASSYHFSKFPAQLIEKAGAFTGNTFKFLLVDSWECGYQNWTRNFSEEFQKRRGYSLLPYLPVLCGDLVGSAEKSEAVLYDFRRTIADLIDENYYQNFAKLCHENKLELHAEVIYGDAGYPPLDILKATQCIDLPMWEYWTSTNSENIVQYSPSARVDLNLPACAVTGYGKQILGAESYTGMAHYSESPKDLKPFGDKAYCSGINQFILHSYVHQPTDNKPGMTLREFGSHFNRNNSVWPYLSEWLRYQARVQYVLQQGVVVQDLLYYLGDQLPQFYGYGPTNSLPSGYQVNACNFDILKNRTRVVEGKIRLNEASDYALLSLPTHPSMNWETLQRIGALVKEGAVVYGPKPVTTLSSADLDHHAREFQSLADELWGAGSGQPIIEHGYGKGRVFWGMPISEALTKIKLKPDFATNKPDAEGFHFIHKKAGETDLYFVANQRDTAVSRDCLFRLDAGIPEIWNPENGTVTHPAVYRIEGGQIRIPASFAPFEAKLFVFKPGKAADHFVTVERDGKQLFPDSTEELPVVLTMSGGTMVSPTKEGTYTFITSEGKSRSGTYAQAEEVEVSVIKGRIEFEGGNKAEIQPVDISTLYSLTESQNPEIRYFSGKASYVLKFETPTGFSSSSDNITLDIGNFESVARVTLNGKALGDLWRPGTKLNVSGLLRPENELTVTVANVYRNRFIGDFALYGKVRSLWTSSPIAQFLDKDKALKPSGLMGPVRLIKIKQELLR